MRSQLIGSVALSILLTGQGVAANDPRRAGSGGRQRHLQSADNRSG